MADTALNHYLFASDFDQTLTFNDPGILEKIVGWQRPRIREFLEGYGFLIQEWD